MYEDESQTVPGPGRGLPEVDEVAVKKDNGNLVLVIDGEECCLPGGNVDVSLNHGGQAMVRISSLVYAGDVRITGQDESEAGS